MNDKRRRGLPRSVHEFDPNEIPASEDVESGGSGAFGPIVVLRADEPDDGRSGKIPAASVGR